MSAAVQILLCAPPVPVLPPPEKHILVSHSEDTVFLEVYHRGSCTVRVMMTPEQAEDVAAALLIGSTR